MRVERRDEEVSAGPDILIRVETDPLEGHVTRMVVATPSELTDMEMVERVAQAFARIRVSRGDYRKVCSDHGYHDGICMECVKERTPPGELLLFTRHGMA